jgi:hypothetical protein
MKLNPLASKYQFYIFQIEIDKFMFGQHIEKLFKFYYKIIEPRWGYNSQLFLSLRFSFADLRFTGGYSYLSPSDFLNRKP